MHVGQLGECSSNCWLGYVSTGARACACMRVCLCVCARAVALVYADNVLVVFVEVLYGVSGIRL